MNLKLFFSARRQPILSYLEQQQKLFRESSASICNKVFLGNFLDDKDEINYISGLSCTTICKKQCVQVVRHRKSLLAENGCITHNGYILRIECHVHLVKKVTLTYNEINGEHQPTTLYGFSCN